MNNTRRSFIRNTGMSALGLGLLPAIARIEDIVDFPSPILLPRMSPESQGISSAAIRQFIAAAKTSGVDWHSFMLLRHGNVIAEGWWKPFEPHFKHKLYSLSKSFTSTAIGFLVSEGRISVEDPVISFFKKDLPASVSDNLAKMKVKHLLTMNTGHATDTNPKLKSAVGSTWVQTFLAQPVEFGPGTHFLYNSGATYMLGAIVMQLTGQKLEDYLRPRIFDPLEIKGYDWEVSPQGLNTASAGLRIKTEDIARFGQLYLQKGKWQGKQLIPENWINEATKYQTSSQAGNGDWSQGYGYQFWRCKPGFYRGDGAYGQFCFVMPEQDAVLAVTSESSNMQKSMTTIWETILPAIQNGPIAENPSEWESLKTDLKNLSLPVTKGSITSPLAAKYDDKKFTVAENEFGVTKMKFKFSNKGCSWVLNTAKGDTTLQFGWENWQLNSGSPLYVFPVPERLDMPSKTAGSATWINDNTLQLNLRFVESMHGDKITVKFDEEKATASFLHSVAEMTKNTSAEKRLPLTTKLG
jgi:CubicO group peptidase (beta-lactamase class C family)